MDAAAPAAKTAATEAEGESRRFEVRSITGARYTLVEDTSEESGERRYRTAYAGLPVTANSDGSFTIVDTHTRLARIDASR
jgi:hypothetical protein